MLPEDHPTEMEQKTLNDCQQLFWKFHSLTLYFTLIVYSMWPLFLTLGFVFIHHTPNQDGS